MSIQTAAGSTLHVCAAQPATYDATGYNALAWVLVGEISDLGEFGREYNKIKFNPVGSRGTKKKKGSFDEGEMNLQMALDKNDAGQTILKNAVASDADFSIKVTSQEGDKWFFQSQVASYKRHIGTVDDVVMANVSLDITTNNAGVGVVEELAP